jgi:hypothetical protein
MLLKHVQWREDALGKQVALHYLRTKDGAEVDFALSEGATLTDLVECKLGDATASRAMHRFAAQWPTARAVQLVRFLRNEEVRRDVQVRAAAGWLAALAA